MSFQDMDSIVNKFFSQPVFQNSGAAERREKIEDWKDKRAEELMDICIRSKRVEGGWYYDYTASASDDAVAYLMDNQCFEELCDAIQGKPLSGFNKYIEARIQDEAEKAIEDGLL